MSVIKTKTVGIVGTGNVGMAAAFAVFIRGLTREIILVDKDHRRAEGEAMDLMHGQMFAEGTLVRDGDFADLAATQLVIICAGVGQQAGESRLALLNRNVTVLKDIVAALDQHAPDAVLIIASNPVDILTFVVQELTKRPLARVIGTGTLLDTGRFRALLGQYYGVDPSSVHAYILGEHGDSEVPIWSSASIGGQLIYKHTVLGKQFNAQRMKTLFMQVRNAADEIIQRKGYTNTAIGAAIAKLSKAILNDRKIVLPISIRLTGQYGLDNVSMSLPCLLGKQGVEGTIFSELNEDEMTGLRRSAAILQGSMEGLEI